MQGTAISESLSEGTGLDFVLIIYMVFIKKYSSFFCLLKAPQKYVVFFFNLCSFMIHLFVQCGPVKFDLNIYL